MSDEMFPSGDRWTFQSQDKPFDKTKLKAQKVEWLPVLFETSRDPKWRKTVMIPNEGSEYRAFSGFSASRFVPLSEVSLFVSCERPFPFISHTIDILRLFASQKQFGVPLQGMD